MKTLILLGQILIWVSLLTGQTNPKWHHYTNTSEINDMTIKDNYLWIATEGGVVKYNLQTQEKRVYTSTDSLVEATTRTIGVSPSNKVYVYESYLKYLINAYDSRLVVLTADDFWTEIGHIGDPMKIKFDQSGNMWTASGARYQDGKFYGVPLPNRSTCIEIDSTNRIWYGLADSGVVMIKNAEFTRFTTSNCLLANDHITSASVDGLNRIWFAHGTNQVSMFDGSDWHVYNMTNISSYGIEIIKGEYDGDLLAISQSNCTQSIIEFNGSDWNIIYTTSQGIVLGKSIETNNDGTVYFSTHPTVQTDSISYFNDEGTIISYNKILGFKKIYLDNHSIPFGFILSIAEDKNGSIWVGSILGGVAKWDGTEWTKQPRNLQAMFPSATVQTIAIDSNNVVWCGGGGVAVSSGCGFGYFVGGLASFDGNNWEVYSTSNSGLPNDDILSITVDKLNRKWIGSHAGVTVFDGTNWTTYNTSNSGLISNVVGAIRIDSKENHFFVTDSGLCIYNGNSWRRDSKSFVVWFPAITNDSYGNVWCYSNGVFRYDDTGWVQKAPPVGGGLDGLAIDTKGTIWGSNYREGVYSYNGHEWVNYNTENSSLGYNYFHTAYADRKGNKWFPAASFQGGLSVFNEDGISLTRVEYLLDIPRDFVLANNYPNPFNPSTTISYTLPNRRFVTLKVYDILGREVAMLVNEVRDAGEYVIHWNAENFPSGAYIYRIVAGDYIRTKKMLLLK